MPGIAHLLGVELGRIGGIDRFLNPLARTGRRWAKTIS